MTLQDRMRELGRAGTLVPAPKPVVVHKSRAIRLLTVKERGHRLQTPRQCRLIGHLEVVERLRHDRAQIRRNSRLAIRP